MKADDWIKNNKIIVTSWHYDEGGTCPACGKDADVRHIKFKGMTKKDEDNGNNYVCDACLLGSSPLFDFSHAKNDSKTTKCKWVMK